MAIRDTVHSRLAASADLTALLTGGIYKRPLKRAGPGATPDAYAPTAPYQPRPAAVVTDDGDEADPFGPLAAYAGFLDIWFYAPSTESGKATLAQAWEIAFGLLHRWRFTGLNLTGAEAMVIGRLGVMDDPVDETGRVVDRMRVQISGLWRNLD